jgi:L-rhamnose mutarotase
VDEYEHVHASIPRDLEQDIRDAGCVEWTIHRSETILTHVLRVHDEARFFGTLDRSAAHVAWQLVVGPMLEPAPLTMLARPGRDLGKLVWRLPVIDRDNDEPTGCS